MKNKLTIEEKEYIESLEKYEINREDKEYSDDDTQIFFIYSDFMLEIINLRRKQGLTQKNLADKIGLQKEDIECFENMYTIPNIEFMYKVSKALGRKLKITTEENK